MGAMAVDEPGSMFAWGMVGPALELLESTVIFTKAPSFNWLFSAAFFSCLKVRLSALQVSQLRHLVPGMIKLQQPSSRQLYADLERRGIG
jgi:hypothetical protein